MEPEVHGKVTAAWPGMHVMIPSEMESKTFHIVKVTFHSELLGFK